MGVEASFLVVHPGPLHLVLVDGDTDDVGTGMRSDGPHRTSDAAANIENASAGVDGQEIHSPFLMDSGGIAVGFARDGGREMERLAPTPLVDISDKVIESIDKGGDFLSSLDLFRSAEKRPVLFILVLNFLSVNGAAREMYRPLSLLLGRAKYADEPVKAAGKEGGSAEEGERIHERRKETKKERREYVRERERVKEREVRKKAKS